MNSKFNTLSVRGQWKALVLSSVLTLVASSAFASVNVNNGNFYVAYTDFLVPTPGLNIEITRTYNSRSNYAKGFFGPGWSSDLDSYLSFEGKMVSYHEGGGGNLARFAPKGKIWENGVFGYQTIEKSKNGYVLHTTFAKDLFFDAKGKLERIADRNKNGIDLIYKDGLISMLKDNFNIQIKVK